MVTETLPLFLRLVNTLWEQVKTSTHRVREYINKVCSLHRDALNELSTNEIHHHESFTPTPSKRHTQWVLAEKTGTDKKRNVMMVEVEYFNDSHIHNTATDYNISNYTIDGEDPNLRITHYPPSNRIH